MNNFENIVNALTKDKIYIQTHNFPDPDAISSAYGLQKLLETRNIKSKICYKGKIDRYSTMKMVEVFNIELFNLDDLQDLTEDSEVVLVDSQKGNANIIDMTGDEVVCIDHHPTFEKIEYKYSDIRPEVGACASIIASYYYENGIKMDKDVASALVFGIRVDTANLTRGVSELDFEMFYKMSEIADCEMISSLGNNTLHYNDLGAYAHAINSIKIFDDISFANAGIECPETLIASVSDFMLALVEVRFSVVYSVRKDGIKLSIRNERPELDGGQIAFRALNGIGSGGGHITMAGGFIPLEENVYKDKHKISIIINNVIERFLKEISEFEL